MTFEQWMQAVDGYVSAIAMVSVYDLADQPFRDWFDDEMTPKEAALEALRNEGWR